MTPGSPVIFHHPLPLTPDPRSGSQVRPQRMLEALGAIGFEVVQVTGYSGERSRTMASLRRDVTRGQRFGFVYAESSTTPMALNDPHHLPLRPRVDASFFAALRRAGVPIGLFYRDVYWRFDLYRRSVPTMRRLLALQAYGLEWRQIRRNVDHLFLPSLRMLEALPSGWPPGRVHALPPGADVLAVDRSTARTSGPLRLLYVGGAAPPLYDLSWIVDAVRSTSAHLTICCRPEDAGSLPDLRGLDVEIVHGHRTALDERYREADLAVMAFPPHPYRSFAVPVKLLEAVGSAVPVIVNRGTAAGDLVEAEQLGWTVDSAAGLEQLLRQLPHDRRSVDAVRRRMIDRRWRHTWEARAEDLASKMLRPMADGSQPAAAPPDFELS